MEGQTATGPRRRRILIVEDHLVVRHGIVQIINQEPDLEVCGQAEDVSGALACLPELSPDLVLVDLSLKGSSGLDLIKAIKKSYPTLPVVVLSMHDELLHGQSALRAGAKGYIMKRAEPEILMSAIRRVLNGDTHISPQLVSRLLDRSLSEHGNTWGGYVDRLSNRERQVFQLIGKGLGTREVADALGVSVKTVESHRESIKTKLGINRATELQRAAFQWVEAEKAREP
jgi:DNA-binding NarL/FixJ family response regulator